MEIKKTALNLLHKKQGAKFVFFAGYEMPIQYSGGIIEEHKATREKAGIFDVSHMGQLFIKGENQLAADLEKYNLKFFDIIKALVRTTSKRLSAVEQDWTFHER